MWISFTDFIILTVFCLTRNWKKWVFLSSQLRVRDVDAWPAVQRQVQPDRAQGVGHQKALALIQEGVP